MAGRRCLASPPALVLSGRWKRGGLVAGSFPSRRRCPPNLVFLAPVCVCLTQACFLSTGWSPTNVPGTIIAVRTGGPLGVDGGQGAFFVKPPAFWSEEFYLTMTFSRERVQKCFPQHETLDLHFRKNNPAMNCEHALEGEANDQHDKELLLKSIRRSPTGSQNLPHLFSISSA